MIIFNLEKLMKAVLHPFSHESEMVDAILEVKDIFTVSRHRLSEYVRSARLISAYTLFYLPTNFFKFSFLTEQLPEQTLKDWTQCDFIDVGTGPGTFTLAFLDFAGPSYQGKILAMDDSPMMLEQAKKCLNLYFPEMVNSQQVAFSSDRNSLRERERRSILFFGHSLNEMGPERAMEIILKVRPYYIVLLEPGTAESFKGPLQLRKRMRTFKVDGESYQILYPCARLDASCPMEEILERGEKDWCHQKMRHTLPPDWGRLGQLLSLDRHLMPMITHVYVLNKRKSKSGSFAQKGENPENEKVGRLFRLIRETKFGIEWEICLEEASKLVIIRCEILKKDHDKMIMKALKEKTPGMKLHFFVEKSFSSGLHRIRLISL